MPLNVHNAEMFAKHIELPVKTHQLSYMDAILQFCEERQIEPETVAPFISAKMKNHIAREAEKLHLLPKSDRLID